MSALRVVPVDFAEANAFVATHHRHHKPMPGAKFSVAVAQEGAIVGVAMVGRPVARMLDDGWTLEVNRVATDGTRNACSILYAAAWRTARAMGYRKFSVAVAQEDAIVGVAMVGRPVARMLDDGWTLEVNRVATDGTRNACSILYAAAWRTARAMGYRKLVTYILDSEPGTSLRAAGWKCLGETGGGSWHCPSRPRVDKHPTQGKIRWEVGASVMLGGTGARRSDAGGSEEVT